MFMFRLSVQQCTENVTPRAEPPFPLLLDRGGEKEALQPHGTCQSCLLLSNWFVKHERLYSHERIMKTEPARY